MAPPSRSVFPTAVTKAGRRAWSGRGACLMEMVGQIAVTGAAASAGKAAWRRAIEKYRTPSNLRALTQVANTFIPYVLLWAAMWWSLKNASWWLTLPLAVIAGLLLVRSFIIFHARGHGSFFSSRAANDTLGIIAGILTCTPYYQWRWEHAVHHSTSGHLDKRGTGDIWTMTVQEYLESSRWKRFAYVLARNPVLLFLFAPMYMFVI